MQLCLFLYYYKHGGTSWPSWCDRVWKRKHLPWETDPIPSSSKAASEDACARLEGIPTWRSNVLAVVTFFLVMRSPFFSPITESVTCCTRKLWSRLCWWSRPKVFPCFFLGAMTSCSCILLPWAVLCTRVFMRVQCDRAFSWRHSMSNWAHLYMPKPRTCIQGKMDSDRFSFFFSWKTRNGTCAQKWHAWMTRQDGT